MCGDTSSSHADALGLGRARRALPHVLLELCAPLVARVGHLGGEHHALELAPLVAGLVVQLEPVLPVAVF